MVIGICALFYIHRSAMSCAKFGVVVFKASILDWRGDIDHRYMCIVLYIYISAISCAKFGVVVFKASMLNWRGDIGHRYVYFYMYIHLPLDLPSLV